MVKRQLRPGAYMRYVDDFLLFDDSKRRLEAMRRAIECKLEELRVRIHPRKSRVYRGRLMRGNVVGFGRRLRELQRSHSLGETQWDEVCQRVRAWIAHAAHGETWRLRQRWRTATGTNRRTGTTTWGFVASGMWSQVASVARMVRAVSTSALCA